MTLEILSNKIPCLLLRKRSCVRLSKPVAGIVTWKPAGADEVVLYSTARGGLFWYCHFSLSTPRAVFYLVICVFYLVIRVSVVFLTTPYPPGNTTPSSVWRRFQCILASLSAQNRLRKHDTFVHLASVSVSAPKLFASMATLNKSPWFLCMVQMSPKVEPGLSCGVDKNKTKQKRIFRARLVSFSPVFRASLLSEIIILRISSQ